MWNPFKKKQQIYSTSNFLGSFGSQKISFNEIYKSKQDNELLTYYFNNVVEVAAPILKYADLAKQVKLFTENKDVLKLLKNPNYYQGFDEFFSLLILNKRLYGEVMINSLNAGTISGAKKPNSLFILAPQFTSIKLTGQKDFRENPISAYLFDSNEIDKNALTIEPENILHLKEMNPNFKNNQFLFGESRYAGCYRNIESIIEGYSAKVNIYKNNPRLIITGKSQGEFASMGTTESIANVQEAMSKYGYGADKYNNLITDVPLDVTNVSLNVAQMQLNENNTSDFQRLCDAQGIDSKVFSDSSSSTYANKEAAIADFANGSFKSEIEATVRDFQTFLQRWYPDLTDLMPDYSAISEITKAGLKENDRLLIDTEKGLMTRNEYLVATNKPERVEPEFNELYFLTSNGWTNGKDANKDVQVNN